MFFFYILEQPLSCCSGRRESHGEQGAPSEGFSEMALRQFSTVWLPRLLHSSENRTVETDIGTRSNWKPPPPPPKKKTITRVLQVSQLLQKLRTDLHLSFHSFLKEFVAEPNDGVKICNLLENCQFHSSFWVDQKYLGLIIISVIITINIHTGWFFQLLLPIFSAKIISDF